MRRSFDGLYALPQQLLQQNPLSGHLFAFINRRATQDQTPIRAGCAGPDRLKQAYFWPLYGELDEITIRAALANTCRMRWVCRPCGASLAHRRLRRVRPVCAEGGTDGTVTTIFITYGFCFFVNENHHQIFSNT